MGNKINVTHDLNDVTGLTNSINARVGTTTIQNLTYQWDRIGNLTYQWDTINNLNQDYQYDSLNRLTVHRSVQGTTTTTQTLQYNALGNITYKSDVGNYSYGASCTVGGVSIKAGIHAVTNITGSQPATYCYDKNGNQVSGAGRNITYTPFNKPSVVTKGSTTTQFFYDFNRALYKKVENGETTMMLGSYEQVTSATGTVNKIYIGNHTLITQNGTTFTPSYLLRDHLGSLVAVADKNGIVQEKLSYDAWGKRRNINGTAISLSVLNAFKPKFSQKGFTNHKHVDSVGLIHMNGRMYDPITARFLSADPIIQSPSNLQSVNRYSYVMNNPLSFVDPSGYFLNKLVDAITDGLKAIQGAAMVVIGIGVAVFGGTAVTLALGPVAGSLAVSIGLAIAQMGENRINGRPTTENVTIEASVSLPFDHGSFDNSKPAKPSTGTGSLGTGGCMRRSAVCEAPPSSQGIPITPEQQALADNGKYIDFYQSRLESGDPIARTGLIGWGESKYVPDAQWWEIMAAKYTWSTLETYITQNQLTVSMDQIGVELVKAYATEVDQDYFGIPHSLSPRQAAKYHHDVFGDFGIPPHIFGGTMPIPLPYSELYFMWNLPRPIFDANAYSELWCKGCDTVP